MPSLSLRLAAPAGNPLANTVSECKPKDQSYRNFQHLCVGWLSPNTNRRSWGYIGSYITKPLFVGHIANEKKATAHQARSNTAGTKARPGHSGSLAPPTSFLADQQNESSASYQHRNQNTENERNNPMQTGPDFFRPSAFLRCSEAQPEEKFVHRGSSALLCGSVLTTTVNILI
jgi:hypothetical protein